MAACSSSSPARGLLLVVTADVPDVRRLQRDPDEPGLSRRRVRAAHDNHRRADPRRRSPARHRPLGLRAIRRLRLAPRQARRLRNTPGRRKQNVGSTIDAALPVTASLVAGGMVLMLLVDDSARLRSQPFGRAPPLDRGLLASSVAGIAIHPFVLGILILDFFASHLPRPSTDFSLPRRFRIAAAGARRFGRLSCREARSAGLAISRCPGSSSRSSSSRSTCE